jgi:hypothetical protein
MGPSRPLSRPLVNFRTELDSREVKPVPWTAEDAERHTKKADSAKRQRMWADIANSVLTETGDEGRATRPAQWWGETKRSLLDRHRTFSNPQSTELATSGFCSVY